MTRLLGASLPRYRPLLAMAIYTGMRHSELLGLTWSDLDLEPGSAQRCQLHPRSNR
ncbi:MAG TPA: hypothetical protein DCP25_04150 [Chloroflexi bacterium]|nr:hypothetical protein [Chloroflexota bacterium]